MTTGVPHREQVYATLLLTDSYLPGALVLAHSLRDAGASRKLAVFVTLDSVSADSVTQLQAVFDHVVPVPRLRNEHPANLYLMNRPELDSAFTKINLWKQTQFSKIVYIDADVVAYRAPDELFTLQQAFAAAPDIGWPDIFNTGVMVLTPNFGDYYALLAMAERGISFDGADQGLLNMYFKNTAHRLSFTYNVTPSVHYQYLPAYRHFQSSINMVHFIGSNKPWFDGRHAMHGDSPFGEMIGRWWSVYDRHYRHQKNEPNKRTSCEEPLHPQSQPAEHPHQLEHSHQSEQERGASEPQPQSQTYASTEHHAERSIQLPEVAWAPPPVIKTVEDTAQKIQPSKNTHPRDQSWDAQRQPPPKDSKPEAENFPSTHYAMSEDVKPFVPPARYPSPPKDMWYEVPKERPAPSARPTKRVFPWESQQPQASRIFPALPDDPPSAASNEVAEPAKSAVSEFDDASTVLCPASKAAPTDIWSSFTLVNSWDDIPEISRYVERTRRHHQGKSSQISLTRFRSADVPDELSSEPKPVYPGLKLTDFPTEIERPSLPVTPAPIRRPSFWGTDGDDACGGEASQSIPTAEGVPAQSEWDPEERLQKLAAHHSEELLRRLSGTDSESLDMYDESPATASKATPVAVEPNTGVLSPTPVTAEVAPCALERQVSGSIARE